MRRLGIDARKVADFGIGSYLQGLLAELVELAADDGVVVMVSPENRDLLPTLPESWQLVEVDAAGYSLKEQLVVPLAAVRAGIKVLHVPHYVIPLLYPGRVVVTVHDIIHVLFPEFLPNSLAFAYARLLIRSAVRRARRVITVSQTTADDLKRLFGASDDRLQVIPNGVAEEFFAVGDEEADGELRDRLGVGPSYLLHVGNHKPHKNVEGVLKAYQLLIHQGVREIPPLVLVGGFMPDGPLAQRARSMGLGDRVRCLGHLERCELAALFRGAALFVYPTLYEGFGLPVLEAMACGAPVVAGDVAAIREVAGDGVVRVNPRDVVELANAIRYVLDKPDLQGDLRQRGRASAARYHWRRTAEATLAVYRAVQEQG
jgi:glycosyltransferase involved in cell wall biosynthesis